MAKTEAFCTQCGSLIMIDDSKEKNKCLFCGTEIVTTKALDLKNDTETRVMLQKEAEKKAVETSKAKKELQKQNKGTKSDAVAAAPAIKEVVVIKPLPLKTKLILFGSLLAVLLILAGIFIPTILSRNEKRELFTSQLTQQITFNIKNPLNANEYNLAYKFNDNRELLLATDTDITETAAVTAYQTYYNMYKDAYSMSVEKAHNKIVVKVYGKNGLFLCKYSNGAVVTSFETATPTPTTVPTNSITSK